MKKKHYFFVALISLCTCLLYSFGIQTLRTHRSVDSIGDLGLTAVPNKSYVTVPADSTNIASNANLWVYCDSCTGATNWTNNVWSSTAPTSSGRFKLTYWNQPRANWNQTDPTALDYIRFKPTVPTASAWYNKTGVISTPTKWQLFDVTTPATANVGNGYSVDISAAGFTTVLGVIPVASKNTSSATSAPKVSTKAFTNTTVTLNIYEGNGATVSLGLLGISANVLNGVSEQFVSSATTVTLLIIGY